MKNQNVLRILVVVLTIAMMLSVASCLGGGDDKVTTPEQTSVTTPKATTPEATTPEPTTPEHVHTEEVIPGKEATCAEAGLTEGKKCSECGEILVPQETIPALPHTEEVVTGKAATCTETGLTDGKKCTVCGTTTVEQEVIPATGHTEEVIPGKAATCTETGLTDGKKCTVCGETTVAQEVIPVADHTFVDGVCSVCGAPEVPACETHSYEVDALTNPARFEKTWGVCTVCGYIADEHTHKIENGKCVYCDFEFSTSDVTSKFDADGDGAMDVYKFSAALPEKFNNAIHLNAFTESTGNHMEYDEIRAGSGKMPYGHVYCSDGVTTDAITFTVTVDKAGIYEVAVHIRLKDQKERGATFVINEGTANEQKIPATYGWATADEAIMVRDSDGLQSAYYTGLSFVLQEGENTISIKVAEGVAKSQHFRDLYLVLVEEAPKTVTVEEAIEIGMTYEKAAYSEEYYYVTLTLDNQVNANGFARATIAEGLYVTVAGGYLTGDAEGTIKVGDTVTFLAKLGAANSAMTTGGKELRLYEVKSWEIVTPEA